MLKRVMVFGSTGQGKSSLINLLSGRFDAKTGNDAEGVTTDLSEYPAKSPDGVSYTLVDTAGLNEANDGTVPAMQAFLQLTRILRDTKSQGFCLALMVTQTSRLSDQAFAQNYEIFVNCMLKDLGVLGVPVILVKLGCELLSDWKTGWYCKASPEGRSVKELIKDRYPAFHDVVGGTAITGSKDELDEELVACHAKKGQALKQEVWGIIMAASRDENQVMSEQSYWQKVKKVWNAFWGSVFRGRANVMSLKANDMIEALKKTGMSNEEAKELVRATGV